MTTFSISLSSFYKNKMVYKNKLMRKGTLVREETSSEGTFGLLTLDDGFKVYTGELPWRNNIRYKSCVPGGTYRFVIVNSPLRGKCYEAADDPQTIEKENVPNRDHIQIHSANFMGDTDKKFKCELLGCIAPGMFVDTLLGQKAIINSKRALKMLEDNLKGEPFMLKIEWEKSIMPCIEKKEEK